MEAAAKEKILIANAADHAIDCIANSISTQVYAIALHHIEELERQGVFAGDSVNSARRIHAAVMAYVEKPLRRIVKHVVMSGVGKYGRYGKGEGHDKDK